MEGWKCFTVLMDGLAQWLRCRTSSFPSSVPTDSTSPQAGLRSPTTSCECEVDCYVSDEGQRTAQHVLLAGWRGHVCLCFTQPRTCVCGPAAGHGLGNLVPQALAQLTQHSACARDIGCIPSSELHTSLGREEMGPQRGGVT